MYTGNTIYGEPVGYAPPSSTLVDQVYDAKSGNAQSGRAIADVLATYISFKDNIEWVFNGGDSKVNPADVIIDDIPSTTSEALITNRAITNYINEVNNSLIASITAQKEQFITNNTALEFNLKAYAEAKDAALKTAMTAYVDTRTTDYIIEQVVNERWTYRKWASGVVECWYIGPAINIDWAGGGAVYYSTNKVNISFPNELFLTTPNVSAMFASEGGAYVSLHLLAVTKAGCEMCFSRIYGGIDSSRGNIHLNLIGRWK